MGLIRQIRRFGDLANAPEPFGFAAIALLFLYVVAISFLVVAVVHYQYIVGTF